MKGRLREITPDGKARLGCCNGHCRVNRQDKPQQEDVCMREPIPCITSHMNVSSLYDPVTMVKPYSHQCQRQQNTSALQPETQAPRTQKAQTEAQPANPLTSSIRAFDAVLAQKQDDLRRLAEYRFCAAARNFPVDASFWRRSI
jgi:hypothetical protein